MGSRKTIALLAALMSVLIAVPLRAADRREVVKRAKAATVIVEDAFHQFGSAVCIDPSGFFITVSQVGQRLFGTDGTIAFNSGLPDERRMKVRLVVTVDDVSLLQVVEPIDDLPTLQAGRSDGLVETSQILTVGYPFGTVLAEGKDRYPEVTINTGRVTALRRRSRDKTLSEIQIDAPVNPGNDGGPLLDEEGKIVGLVYGGTGEMKIGAAVPIEHIWALCSTPRVSFVPPAIPFDKRHDPAQFLIHVLTAPGANPVVQLTLEIEKAAPRTLNAAATPAGYVVKTAPIPPGSESATLRYTVSVHQSTVTARGATPTEAVAHGQLAFVAPSGNSSDALAPHRFIAGSASC